MTLLDVLIVLAVIAFLGALVLLPALGRVKARSIRMCCINSLKQTGLGFLAWSGDHGGEYPMTVPETNGGSMEFATGPNVFRHFQVMSNELITPGILLCPSEWDRAYYATNFAYLRNSNLSYFVGVDAKGTNNATMILSGDRNITNGLPVKNGMLELTKNGPARWTAEMHNGVGNILLADDTVLQVGKSGLRDVVANTGFATNRLQMP